MRGQGPLKFGKISLDSCSFGKKNVMGEISKCHTCSYKFVTNLFKFGKFINIIWEKYRFCNLGMGPNFGSKYSRLKALFFKFLPYFAQEILHHMKKKNEIETWEWGPFLD